MSMPPGANPARSSRRRAVAGSSTPASNSGQGLRGLPAQRLLIVAQDRQLQRRDRGDMLNHGQPGRPSPVPGLREQIASHPAGSLDRQHEATRHRRSLRAL